MRFVLSGDQLTWNWGCSKCKGEPEGDDKRELRNCDGETNKNIAWNWAPELRRCPWSQIDAQSWEIIHSWQQLQQYSTTPWGPDVLAAPAWWVEAMELCDRVKADVEEHRTKQQAKRIEREAKRNGPRRNWDHNQR